MATLSTDWSGVLMCKSRQFEFSLKLSVFIHHTTTSITWLYNWVQKLECLGWETESVRCCPRLHDSWHQDNKDAALWEREWGEWVNIQQLTLLRTMGGLMLPYFGDLAFQSAIETIFKLEADICTGTQWVMNLCGIGVNFTIHHRTGMRQNYCSSNTFELWSVLIMAGSVESLLSLLLTFGLLSSRLKTK